MPKYSLIAKNIIDDKQIVLIPKKSLIEIDRFIYETFSDLEGVCKYFNVPPNSKLFVAYTYNRITKYLDLLFKHKFEFNLSSILKTASGSSINDQNDDFINIFNRFISVFTIDEINYLYDRGYINKRIYDNLFEYKNLDVSSYQTYADKQDIVYSTKKQLLNYLNFRKLCMGISKYQNKDKKSQMSSDDDLKRIIATEDELLNSLFNNGDMDSVYSNYDLDDLLLIDGHEQLPIDILKKKK